MSVNTMNFEQASAVLSSMYKYVTGQTISTPANAGEFTSVATTLLQNGYDPILRSINQIITETIFAVRPYDAQLRGMEVDSQVWGGIVRKLNFLDKKIADYDDSFPRSGDLSDDPSMIRDGISVDMFVQNKPAIVQTNFYGGNLYSDWVTIYENGHYGLQAAFESPAQFAAFWSAILTQMQNKLEQFVESEKRLCLINMIGGRLAEYADARQNATFSTNATSVKYLLSEYKDETGNATITKDNWKSESEIKPFIKWLYAYLNTLVRFMSERTMMYHTNLALSGAAAKGIDPNSVEGLTRFTRPSDMHCYMLTEVNELIRSMVLSSTFNQDLLQMLDYDTINFWQNPNDPAEINATVTAFDETTGTVKDNLSASSGEVVGVIFDRDALGVTRMNEATYQTPFNARGRYTNQWFHRVVKWWNDFTENSIVLVMDDDPFRT